MSACGTYAGHARHQRQGEAPCDPCKEAAAEYRRAWRAQNGPGTETNRRKNRLRWQAMRELRRRHPGEYMEILFALEDEAG